MTSLHPVGRLVRFLLNSSRILALTAIACLAMSASAVGRTELQSAIQSQAVEADDVPAHIAIVDGVATLERDGRAESSIENIALVAGDRVRTERGRVEVLFADGSTLDVDQYSTVDFLDDSLMRLLAGRARLTIVRLSGSLTYRVDTSPASVVIRVPGDYRLDLSDSRVDNAELDVAVLRGAAELQNAFGTTLVRAGTHARANERTEPSLSYAFNSASWDSFDRWTEDQRTARYGVYSSQYVPADLRYYSGMLDRYGNWGYEPAYGYVWYPRVEPLWRPYYSGRWSFFARFGWLWVGSDRWSWPTHHYGRWGLNASRWFWIPDRRWGPAWVSWASAPGYVGWCPLGFDGRPIVSVADIGYRSGWTTLPARVFGPNVIVSRYGTDGRDLSPAVRASLAVRTVGPSLRDAPRAALPLRSPTAGSLNGAPVDRAVPRASQTMVSPSRTDDAPASRSLAPGYPSRIDPSRTAPRRNEGQPVAPGPGRVGPSIPDRSDQQRALPRAADRYAPPAPEPGYRSRGPEARQAPPSSEQGDARRAPNPSRVSPSGGSDDSHASPPPAREPTRAQPRGGDRAGSPPPSSSQGDSSAQPSPGGRPRPPASGGEGRAVPRGRGRG